MNHIHTAGLHINHELFFSLPYAICLRQYWCNNRDRSNNGSNPVITTRRIKGAFLGVTEGKKTDLTCCKFHKCKKSFSLFTQMHLNTGGFNIHSRNKSPVTGISFCKNFLVSNVLSQASSNFIQNINLQWKKLCS